MSWLLSSLTFRKYSGETVNAAHITKAPATSQPILKPKMYGLPFRTSFRNGTMTQLTLPPHSWTLKVHVHEIFDIRFFSSKASFWSPDQDPKLFSNINSNSPRYSTSKVNPRIIRIRGKTFFCHARAK
jgi:hypothetical protein